MLNQLTYKTNRNWSDKFIPEIKRIVGPYLLDTTSFDIDTKQAADLIILQARDMRIAARVRRSGYAESYGNEFTIRSHLDNGCKTELAKMVDGYGDWMFYAHSNKPENGFDRWVIINLHKWRASLIRHRECIECKKKSNGDGTHFVAFDIRSFPKAANILIASSHQYKFNDDIEATA